MRAYQVTHIGDPLRLQHVPKPIPNGFQVCAKTVVTGVCHTDLHLIQGDIGEVQLPRTPGHEGIGIVEAVGPDVRHLKVGDRVGVGWLGASCTECCYCRTNRQNLCEKQTRTGFNIDGSFAEYFLADERYTVKIPDNVPDEAAAPILCAGVTAYRSVALTEARPGSRIVIAGACGGLGHLAIQYAKALQYEVIALDMLDESKISMAKSLGADFTADLREPQLRDTFKAFEPKKPVEAAVVLAPVAKAVSDAMDYVDPGATIVSCTLGKGDIRISAVTLAEREIHLKGCIVGTTADLIEAFRYVSEGKIHAEVHRQSIDTINDVLDGLASGELRGRTVLHFR